MEELHKHVLGVLPGPEQKLLKELLAIYLSDIAKDELAERVGMRQVPAALIILAGDFAHSAWMSTRSPAGLKHETCYF